MYDRQTNTLWSQLTGEPVFGPLVTKRSAPLQVLPLTVTTWREWRKAHPKTRVVSLDTGYVRDYTPGAAYGKYFASPGTMFPVWKKRDSPLKLKDWVLVVNIDSVRKIYPLEDLERAKLVLDRIGGQHVVLVGERAYLSDGRRFRLDGGRVIDGSGTSYDLTESALVSVANRFERAPSHRAFWFGAAAFYPGTEIWSAGQSP